MKFNHILYHITEGTDGIPLHEQDAQFKKRGRKPRSATFSSNLQIDKDVSDFKDKYGTAIDSAFKKSPMYLLNYQDESGLPVEPSSTITKTVENLNDELRDSDYQVETVWFLDKKKSPLNDALQRAIEELSGKPVTNKTRLGHTARVVRNVILNNTDVLTSVEGSAPEKDEVSQMPGAVDPAPSGEPDVIYAVVRSLKDVVPELTKFFKSEQKAAKLIPILRPDIFKGNELTKTEMLVSLSKTLKTRGINDVNPLELFDFLLSIGVIETKTSATDDDVGQDIDDEKQKIPALDPDKGVDRLSTADVSRYTGGFGPDARGAGSMDDY